MLASKSMMFAKSLVSRPAAYQAAAQRFMSATADLKVNGNQDKPVVI